MGARWIQLGKQAALEIVVVAIASATLLAALILYKYLHPSRTALGNRGTFVIVGSQLSHNIAEFGTHPITLILFTSPKCPYCLASKPFHRQLAAECQEHEVPLYVAVPSRQEASGYLHDVGYQPSAIRQWQDIIVRPEATPTIIAVDSRGIVKRMWVGSLLPAGESEVLNAVRSRSIPESDSNAFEGITNYNTEDLDNFRAAGHISIVDPRERDGRPMRKGAIVMPLIELPFRAPIELRKDDLQLVDCARVVRSVCQYSVERLVQAGFRVATLDAGSYVRSCEATLAGDTAPNQTWP
jgi:hypothetical protein